MAHASLPTGDSEQEGQGKRRRSSGTSAVGAGSPRAGTLVLDDLLGQARAHGTRDRRRRGRRRASGLYQAGADIRTGTSGRRRPQAASVRSNFNQVVWHSNSQPQPMTTPAGPASESRVRTL